MNLTDFTIIDIISRAFTSEVLLVRKNGGEDSGMFYAAKRFSKQEPRRRSLQCVQREKEILEAVRNGPFMNRLKYSFEDEREIIYVLEFLPVEDLGKILRVREFKEPEIKFYGAELVVAIEFLHSRGIIHRDLKPENVGLDSNGHVAIIDFGISKKTNPNETLKRTFTICGTPGYSAPEIRDNFRGGYDNSVDWYSMGACLYKLLTRDYAADSEELSEYPLFFPDGVSEVLQDLITKLLKENPEERLGGGGRGAGEVKAHPFFKDTDWAKVLAQEIQAPDISWISRYPEISAQMAGYSLPDVRGKLAAKESSS